MVTIDEFHQDFIQTVLSDASSRGLFNAQAFYETVCEELVATGEISVNYTEADHKNLRGKMPTEACGYDYDEERKVLSVLIHQFFQEDQIETLTNKIIEQKLKRVSNFILKSIEGLYKDLEETAPAYSMTYFIFDKFIKKEINKIKLFLVTDGKLTRTFKGIDLVEIENITVESRIIDIEYLYKNFISQSADSSFEVEITLPCLEIPTKSEKYNSYLTYLTGNQLVDVYERFGQRLLEQNVRTFLQFKGNVNKGIRNTIEGVPEMFFAYNNGITATASDLDFDDEGNIIKIYDLQIVNGGQTTSSVYAAKKNSKLDVTNISVQMKLSVVKETENHSEFVSKVAEYANTQNKVNKSDFFSNSPFHKEMKQYSSRIWIPAKSGTQKMTRWFYERVRGEYLNEQAYLSKAKQKQFQIENPKSQLVDKTFLSKSENTWLQRPDVVSKGAQYSFSDYATYITELLEKDQLAITESYYRDAISRVILFKTVEKIISDSLWYKANGGYRAQTVTYTIAYLAWFISKQNKYFNFSIIWNEQEIPLELKATLENLASQIYLLINNPPSGHGNVAQWCKKSECWKTIKNANIVIVLNDIYLLDKEEIKYVKKEAIATKKIDTGIEMQTFVYKLSPEKWDRLYRYFESSENRRTLSFTQFNILQKMANGKLGLPSEKQSQLLYKIYSRAIDEGLVL